MMQLFFSRLFLAMCFLFGTMAQATATTRGAVNDSEKGITEAIQHYLYGTSFNDQSSIKKAFYANARLYLSGKDNTTREVGVAEYAQLFSENAKGQFNGRFGRLISIDVSGDSATAKAEILMPKQSAKFIDVFLLKKINGTWQIISKTAERENGPQHGRKILFVVSNFDQYPGTSISAGNNFPELVYTYQIFRKAGYAIDFLSQNGGAVPLEMINTADAVLKQHLYDTNFMWALGHTKSPAEIKASDYVAINYIGGGSAAIGVADNFAIQTLAMEIYQQQGGVIAAICQGTEGISRLKNKDGSYLISGKVLTTFPNEFLNKQSPIFKAHPISLEDNLKLRQGKLTFGVNGKSHIETDGRLVTGMNWESSVEVAEAVIRLLDQKK